MTVHVWRDRDVAIVEPTVDVDAWLVDEFLAALARARSLATLSVVVVDLESAAHVDAAALAAIRKVHLELAQAGGAVALAAVPLSLRRVLALTALDGLLPVYESLEDALRELGSPLLDR